MLKANCNFLKNSLLRNLEARKSVVTAGRMERLATNLQKVCKTIPDAAASKILILLYFWYFGRLKPTVEPTGGGQIPKVRQRGSQKK